MRVLRLLLGTAGVALALVGVWRLLVSHRPGLPALVDIAVWLAAGVALHDAVLGPAVVVVAVLVVPRLPSWSRAPVVAGLVVLLTVTLGAVPVLGRFGAKPTDPWLLPREYAALWLLFAAVVSAAVVVASLLRRRQARRVASGSNTCSG